MHLADLLQNLGDTIVPACTEKDLQETEILGVGADSRHIQPGFLFVAIAGEKADGRDYIQQALDRGATALLMAHEAPPPSSTSNSGNGKTLAGSKSVPVLSKKVPVLYCDNPRKALALLASRLYQGQPQIIAGVTGTSGKTSISFFTQQLWSALGEKAFALGTIGAYPARADVPYALTTCDPVSLHKVLSTMSLEGVQRVVLEASSHGLDQYRLQGVHFSIAAFANISRDHLDYHPDMDSYFQAKQKLFAELLSPEGTAILNADCTSFPVLNGICKNRGITVLSYGKKGEHLHLHAANATDSGIDLHLNVLGKPVHKTIPLFGTFQAYNILAALGIVLASGENGDNALAALQYLSGAPGRLEPMGKTPKGGNVFVDYAHKPGALETVLQAVRPHTKGRLWVVFGCGGDRDKGKRPLMGAIASQNADEVIITDDNPRSEDPHQIRQEIIQACAGAQEIGDRAAAIEHAVISLGPGDTLVIAGKGHETGQIIGGKVHPFSDRTTARTHLLEMTQG